MIEVTLIRFLS